MFLCNSSLPCALGKEEGKQLACRAGTAHANMQINTDCTSDEHVSTTSSVLTRYCQSHFTCTFLCICSMLKCKVTKRKSFFFRILTKNKQDSMCKAHSTAYSSATFNPYCIHINYILPNVKLLHSEAVENGNL